MDIIDGGNGKEQAPQQEAPRKSHETYMREFAGKLNEILSEGFPLPAVIQVLDSALFEMKLNLYFQQVEIMEREKKSQIQIPKMTIPTGKMK